MSEHQEPFGQQLYAELKGREGGHRITGRLEYARIQRLKAADREGVIDVLVEGFAELVEHVRRDSPQDLAAYLEAKAIELEKDEKLRNARRSIF